MPTATPFRARDVWRLLAGFRHARAYVLATAAVSVLASLAEAGTIALVASVALAIAADQAVNLDVGPFDLGSGSTAGALWLAGAAVGVVAASRLVTAFLAARLSTIGILQFRHRVLDAYLRTSWEVQERERAGHIHELASMHAVRVSQTFHTVAALVMSAVSFTVLSLGALIVAPVVSSVMLVLTALMAVLLRPLVKRTRRESGDHLIEHNRVVAAIEEATEVTAEVRVFGVTEQMRARVGATIDSAAGPHMRARFMALVVPGVMTAATLGALVGGLAVIDLLSISEPLGLGVAVLFLLRNMRYAQSAQSAAQLIAEQLPFLEELRDSTNRYLEAVPPVRGSTPLPTVGAIELVGVEYRYPSGELALRGVDLQIDPGDVVGVVGPSGGGKTTLVQVLLGLRSPTAGRVVVSGIDLAEVSSDDWHSLVAYVAQHPRLVSGDVRDNVRFFRPGVSDEDVEQAIAAAGLTNDVTGWASSTDRLVGEAGKELSGGQRQRIALARAFAGRPQLVVLDEPTSALDVTSERRIQTALAQLPDEVTVVLVAHRPSTLTVCDRLLVMEDGLLREVPTPTDEASASVLLASVTGGDR